MTSIEDVEKNLADAIQADQDATIEETFVEAFVFLVAYRELDDDGRPFGKTRYRIGSSKDLPPDRAIGIVSLATDAVRAESPRMYR